MKVFYWIMAFAVLIVNCKAEEDITVEIYPNWKVGTVLKYDVIQKKTSIQDDTLKENSFSKYFIDLRIVKLIKHNYELSWAVRSMTNKSSSRSGFDFNNPIGPNQALHYTTNSRGTFLELLDIESIRAMFDKTMKTFTDTMPEDQKDLLNKMISTFFTKDVLEKMLTSNIILYHCLYGAMLTFNEPARFEDEIENPFGGKPIPTTIELRMSDYNKPDDYYVVECNQMIDKQKYGDMIKDLAGKFSKETKIPIPDTLVNKSFNIIENYKFIFSISDNIIRYLSNTRTTEIGTKKNIDYFEMKLTKK